MQKTIQEAEALELTQPSLPRERKRPPKILNENKVPLYDEVSDVSTFYRHICFNVMDTVTNQKIDSHCQNIEL